MFFKGIDGIRQMAWNILKTKTELLGFTYRPYVEVLGEKFFEEWKKEFDFRKIKFREIYSDEFVERSKALGLAEDLMVGDGSRYISEEVLKVTYQTDIYDEVVAMYNWYEGEVFGVEIHNEKIANFQRQLFELVWSKAIPVRQVSVGGNSEKFHLDI